MSFTPKASLREGSHRDPNKAPRWWRPALGETNEIAGVLVFTPNVAHPALRDFGIREFGPVDDPASLERMEAVYREANARKKSWRKAKKDERAARIGKLPDMLAERRKAA